ncbi:hypothetical protein PAESOLCIP111_04565 [Paenibacillus solanacearum]|uniref:Heparinase II/III-like C-terminal domain-containing protein n=1 Tax=Paenibacillus solanacearum TaxID=2048548 RepID=A0A916K7Q5_9BACL|nr:heparinase II/III family protein [Paenibacillus solanacearum]CAG7643827.1 hypothetical protein PAESOLCIP111_04565 [Paenibacillus solanacearum]
MNVLKTAVATLCMIALLSTVSTPAHVHSAEPVKRPDYTSYSGITVPAEPVLPKTEAHPKLWFDQAQVKTMYDKRSADAYAKSLWDHIAISPYTTMNLPAAPGSCKDPGLHNYYGTVARIAKYSAFLYVMTGSEPHRERAVAALQQAYDGPIYACDPTEDGSEVDETYRGSWAQHFAAAYDWIQPSIAGTETDTAIRARLKNEAEALFANLEKWSPRPHNHLSKPAWGLGTLALTLSGEPEAGAWLRKALQAVNANTNYFFSSDGIYREGAFYYIYSHINMVPFLYHYANVSGVDLFSAYKPAFLWEFYSANNKGWLPTFEDTFLRHNMLVMVAGRYMGERDVSEANPEARWGNLFQWRYANADKSPQGGEFGNNTGASEDDSIDLDKYLTYAPEVKPLPPTGTATTFLNEGGQSFFRNHWNANDPSSRYLAFHGVAETDNHNHFDTLSFTIHAENQLMASAPGYSKSGYGDAIRRSWYRTAAAQNTVTLDGSWPVDMAMNATPVSRYGIDTDFFDFQQKEARFLRQTNDPKASENPLLFPPDEESTGSISRAVAFPGQQYFVVTDQLKAKDGKPHTFDLYLHGGRGTMSGSGNHRLWTYKKDKYGAEAKFAAWIFSDKAGLTDAKGDVTYIKGDAAPFGYVKATVNAAAANYMQVLIPLSPDEALPVVTELSDSARVGGTVLKDGMLDTYVLQQGTGSVSLGKLSLAGEFGYVRDGDGGGLKQWAVKQATTADYDGKRLFASSRPVTMTVDTSRASQYKGYVSGDSGDGPLELELAGPAGRKAVSATFNGSRVEAVNGKGFVHLAVTGGGELVIDYGEPAFLSRIPGWGYGAAAVLGLAVLLGLSLLGFRRRKRGGNDR